MLFGLFSSRPLQPVRGAKGRRRDIKARPTYYERCLKSIIPTIMRVIGTGPSLFSKSPQEHILEARLARMALPYHLRHLSNSQPIPPGSARLVGRPEIEAILPLEPSGEFDLGRARVLWSLDSCAAVDPIRWKLFQPATTDRLSPVAIYNLSHPYGSINIVEPSISECTKLKRIVRGHALPYGLALRTRCDEILDYLRSHTSIMDHVDETQRVVRLLEWRLECWLAESEELTRVICAILVVGFMLYVTTVLQGFIGVDIGARRYARNWIGYNV